MPAVMLVFTSDCNEILVPGAGLFGCNPMRTSNCIVCQSGNQSRLRRVEDHHDQRDCNYRISHDVAVFGRSVTGSEADKFAESVLTGLHSTCPLSGNSHV